MYNTHMDSKSLVLAKQQLGKVVTVTVDRPLGTKHPKWGFEYLCNYGFIEGIVAPDGEELDAYVLNVNESLSKFTGKVVAIVHRLDNDDDKLVVIPESQEIDDATIEKSTEFQEKFFKHQIIR